MWRLSDLSRAEKLLEAHPFLAREPAEQIAGLAEALVCNGLEPSRLAMATLVPGRIEVLGKHTDYAGGRSLVCATEQGFQVVAVPERRPRFRIVDRDGHDRLEIDIGSDPDSDLPGWARYPIAVIDRASRDFGRLERGATIAFSSNLPAAAGMSSSSALVVAVLMAVVGVNRLQDRAEFRTQLSSPESLAEYAAAIEGGREFGSFAGIGGVGTRGGS